MKRENSDVSLFQYKVTVFFFFDLVRKMLTLARYIELYNAQFHKRLCNITKN